MASLLLDQLLEDYATWCGVRTRGDFDLLERLRLGLWLLSPTLLRHVSVLPDNDAWYLGALLTDDPQPVSLSYAYRFLPRHPGEGGIRDRWCHGSELTLPPTCLSDPELPDVFLIAEHLEIKPCEARELVEQTFLNLNAKFAASPALKKQARQFVEGLKQIDARTRTTAGALVLLVFSLEALKEKLQTTRGAAERGLKEQSTATQRIHTQVDALWRILREPPAGASWVSEHARRSGLRDLLDETRWELRRSIDKQRLPIQEQLRQMSSVPDRLFDFVPMQKRAIVGLYEILGGVGMTRNGVARWVSSQLLELDPVWRADVSTKGAEGLELSLRTNMSTWHRERMEGRW